MKSNTETIIKAMRILSAEIHSDDGVANAAIAEAADRLDELQQLSAELAAQVELLRNALGRIHEVAACVDGWESFPQKELDAACGALMATPAKCLAEVKAQAVDNLCPLKFASIAFRHSDEWPKDIELDDIKLAFKFMAENISQQAKAGE